MRVFLSYGRPDLSVATELANELRELGHVPWFDQSLVGGEQWWSTILRAIRDCDVFAPLVSGQSLDSVPCRLETRYACDLRRSILPLLIEPSLQPLLLPPLLSRLQSVRYTPRDQDSLKAITRALRLLPSEEPLPDPLPEEPSPPLSTLGIVGERINGEKPIGRSEQLEIVVDLSRSLQDSTTADSARFLLHKMKQRRDLYAQVATEVDRALSTTHHELAGDRLVQIVIHYPSHDAVIRRRAEDPKVLKRKVGGEITGFTPDAIALLKLTVEIAIKTDIWYPQGEVSVNPDGSWCLEHAFFGGYEHIISATLRNPANTVYAEASAVVRVA